MQPSPKGSSGEAHFNNNETTRHACLETRHACLDHIKALKSSDQGAEGQAGLRGAQVPAAEAG